MARHSYSEKGRTADAQCSLTHDNAEIHLGTFPGVSSLRGTSSESIKGLAPDWALLGDGDLQKVRLRRWLSSLDAAVLAEEPHQETRDHNDLTPSSGPCRPHFHSPTDRQTDK